MTNLTAWLRMYRPAIQRQFDSLPEPDIELIDLLHAADERQSRNAPRSRKESSDADQRNPGKNSRTAD